MKKTCSMCYHCTKQDKCDITGQRVNTTKQRDKCKSWRTSPPRDRSMDKGYGYGADFMSIVTDLAMLSRLGRK